MWFSSAAKSNRSTMENERSPSTFQSNDVSDRFQLTTPVLTGSSEREDYYNGETENLTNDRSSRSRKFCAKLPIILFGLLIGLPSLISICFLNTQPKPCRKSSLVMVMRHAEKPEESDNGMGISEEGKCRAKMLPSLFNGERFPKPKKLFTFIPTEGRRSLRGLETLLPISQQFNIPIYTYKSKDYVQMVHDIQSHLCGDTLLLVWHHNNPSIGDLLVGFGVNELIARNLFELYMKNYDAVWMVDFANNGTRMDTKLTVEFQGLGMDPCKNEARS